jgi:hypothetical protein
MPANRDARGLKRQRSCADGTEVILVASPRDFVTEVQTPPTVPIGAGKLATLPHTTLQGFGSMPIRSLISQLSADRWVWESQSEIPDE